MARATRTKSPHFESPQQTSAQKTAACGGNKCAVISIPELLKATGWEAHSMRGFLAGSLRERHGLEAMAEKRESELRRYRVG